MTAVVSPRVGLRRGHVYGYLTLRPEGGYRSVEFGYGGQSWRRPGVRDREHRIDCEQPWADVIVGSVHIIADGWWTPTELDGLEQAVIGGRWDEAAALIGVEAARRGVVPDLSGSRTCQGAGLRPRYNIADGGLDNPAHIPQWVAVEQRHARDDAAGRPRWVPPKDRVVMPAQRVPYGVCRPAVGRPWPSRLAVRARRALLRWLGRLWARTWPWLTGWTVLFAAVFGLWLWQAPTATLSDAAGLGVCAATAGCVVAGSRRRPRRRGRGRGRRR